MTRARTVRFSEEFLRQVLDVVDEHPLGCTIASVVDATGRQPETCLKAMRIVGEKAWAGSRTAPAQFLRHAEADARIREHVAHGSDGALQPPPALNYAVEGMCPGCTCTPTPSDFTMRDGKPVLLECPKMAELQGSWFTQAPTGPVRRHEIPVPAPELQRRTVLRALRRADEPLTEVALLAATSLRAEELTELLADLEDERLVVRLRRTRPGSGARAVVTVFALAELLPDPLRAS